MPSYHPSCLLKLVLFAGILALIAGCSREAKTKRYLTRANHYFASQEYGKAEIEYLNVLRLDGGNPVALRQLGFALFEQGRYPQAFAFLQRAKTADPNNIEIRSKLGFGELLARNLTQAREEALFILGQQPTNEDALVLVADTTEPNNIQGTKTLLENYRAQAAKLAGFHVALGLVELRANQIEAAEASFKEAIRLSPKSPTARATLGNYYLRQGRPELAEDEFKAATEAAVPRSLLAMSYADFKIKQGRAEEGRKLLEALAQKAPEFIPVTIRLAELAFAQKDYEGCAAILKSILSKGQANFDAHLLQGRLKLARGDTAGAVTEFERLGAAFPKVPQLHYQLALTHLAKPDFALASASLNEALQFDPNYPEAILLRADLDIRKGEYSPAIAAMTELTRSNPNLARAHVLLAAAYAGRKDYAAALEEYQKLAGAFPKNPQFPFLIGNLHLQQKDTNAARQAFERALSVNNDHLPALERVLELDLNSGQADRALKTVQARISETPTNAPLQLLLARVHLAQGETNRAEVAMLKALELDPDQRAGYMMLASLYVNGKQHQAALDRLQAVIAKRTNDIGAHMLAAAIQDELKNFPASRDHYERILAVHPNSPAALNNLAYIYSEHLNQLERALEMAQKARESLPRDPAAADTLGWILYKRGEFVRALSLLQESAQMLPNEPEVLFHLGMVHYALGQEEPARASFEKSLQEKNDFPGKKECEQRLTILTMNVQAADTNTVRLLEKILAESPSDPILLGRLARIYDSAGESAKAARINERVLKQNPNHVAATIQLARFSLDHENNKDRAMELARKARNLAPHDAAVAHSVGLLAYQSGDYQWSLSLLQESARKLPDDPQVAFDLARAQLGHGQLGEAQASLVKAGTVSDPKVQAAANALGKWVSLCLNSESAQASATEIQQTLTAAPGHLPARFLQGCLLRAKGDIKGAQAAFESILKEFPFFAPANKELAYLYSEHLADNQKALDQALKARQAMPRDTQLAKTLGIISYRRNDFRRAADLLKESVNERSADAEVQFYLGMVHFRLGDHAQSREALGKAISMDTNGKFAAEARSTLAQLQ